jgi:hypothetical protein
MYTLFVQFLAILAVLFFIISYHAKSRKKILTLQIISVFIWAVHFLLLNAWTGAALMSINGVVIFAFLFKGKNKLTNSLILYSSLCVYVLFDVLTWTNIYSLFPLLGVFCGLTAKWQNSPKLIRIISYPVSVLWIVYDVYAGAYGSIVAEVLIMISITISLIVNRKK